MYNGCKIGKAISPRQIKMFSYREREKEGQKMAVFLSNALPECGSSIEKQQFDVSSRFQCAGSNALPSNVAKSVEVKTFETFKTFGFGLRFRITLI